MNAGKSRIAIFAECSNQIGTGHLVESLCLLKAALEKDFRISMWVSDASPDSILKKFNYTYNYFSRQFLQDEALKIKERLLKDKCKAIIFNFRNIDNDILSVFKDFKLICIDELGNRRLDCQAIINPTLVKKYHKYQKIDEKNMFFTGPKYLSMSDKFPRVHGRKRPFAKGIKVISVSMGGVDRSGTTLKLVDALLEWDERCVKNIILGGDFQHIDKVDEKMTLLKRRNFTIYRNIDNIEELFFESDVAFTAGGNTLYELACIGTPAIALYEDEHERENGEAFQRLGFGISLGQGKNVSKKDILGAIRRFEDINARAMHSSKGKEIVDGRGSYRILGIVEDLIRDDITIKTAY
jgi:spore coat polysaccharide biosynthesis predicted glycosyltransferase SpsG